MLLSTGASLQGEQGRPDLQVDTLLSVLKTVQNSVRQGVFPTWLAQYQTDRQSWQAYRELRAARVIAWTSDFLGDLPADSTIAPIPPVGEQMVSLANGWLLCLPDQDIQQRELYIKLAQYLAEPDFLAQLTSTAGYLPTQKSTLAGWQNKSMQSTLTPILESAQVPPSSELQAALSPILKDAVLQIINGQSDPARAAQAAVERLGN
jgi:ABC-type glycerol-3-phosphate transport system substrate-binding protein